MRGRPRSFDYDECRALYATGDWTQPELMERFGVSSHAIQYALNPTARAYSKRKQLSYRLPCPECGALVTKPFGEKKATFTGLCVSCLGKLRSTAVRSDSLHCARCDEWKPDSAFPRNRSEKAHRGRHRVCRSCNTAMRREYRERNKVPCSHGCGTLVLHETGGKDPECHPCAMARRKSANEPVSALTGRSAASKKVAA